MRGVTRVPRVTAQLRFRSFVGQTLGVDPELGALLSPTGGLVGPGDTSFHAPEGDVAGLRCEAHDAFGYLQWSHKAVT
jgi:hypothetical protein